MDDLTGEQLRLDWLRHKVAEHKKSLQYWEQMEARQERAEAGKPCTERRRAKSIG